MTRNPTIWEYFDVSDKPNKRARCKNCGKLISYKTTITNLKCHLKQKHIGVFIQFCKRNEAYLGETQSGRISDEPRTTVAIVGGSKKTILCPHTGEQLLAEIKHDSSPNQMEQNFEELENVQGFEEVDKDQEFEEVYLSDVGDEDTVDKEDMVYGANTKPTIKPKRIGSTQPLKKKYQTIKTKRKIKEVPDFSSSDEDNIEILRRCRSTNNDTVEYFSKYLTSLLRNLPKRRANKLQLEFITQVMNEIESSEEDREEAKALLRRATFCSRT